MDPITEPSAPPPVHNHRRTGKIAQLPKVTRNQINTMIDDGLTYLDIIDKLGLASSGINEMTLSRWKEGGYKDWLEQKHLAAAVEANYELALSIAERAGLGNEGGQAVLQIIATNLCEFLIKTDPVQLRASLLSDSDKFTRFVNSMVRLAEGGIKCATHKSNQEDRLAKAAKAKRRKARSDRAGPAPRGAETQSHVAPEPFQLTPINAY